jgi:hypothetical protein
MHYSFIVLQDFVISLLASFTTIIIFDCYLSKYLNIVGLLLQTKFNLVNF